MALVEINFDGIVGPSHNYAGLSLGNLAATGRLAGFRCAYAKLREAGGGLVIDRAGANALGVGEGDKIAHIGRF